MNYDKIGSFIALKRKEKGLTQKDLALKLGVTDKAVSKWERGLGCPDVSILEILSKELDVSILEILKGRMIEDEVIKVTDMNDYVSETVVYSNIKNKENMKILFSRIIAILIIIIGGFLIILNTEHIFYLNKKYEYDFNSDYIVKVKETINKIENNINIIKNNQGVFNDENYQDIINYLDSSFDAYKNIPILEFNGSKKFNINDMYILDLYTPSKLDIMRMIRILTNYDIDVKNIEKLYGDMFFLIGSNETYSEPMKTYSYRLIDFLGNIGLNNDVYKLSQRVYHYIYLIDSYYYLTELIIEVGDISD